MRRTLLALLLPAAASAEPLEEAEAVRRFLAGPVALSALDAGEARARADRAGPPILDNPVLEARHEEANGPAGAHTDAIGGALSFDLGLSSLAERGAARLRGEAAEHLRAAAALEAVCAFRRDATDLWAAEASAAATREAQARLDRLVTTLGALARAGEASGYDRDRAALTASTHQLDATSAEAKRDALRARVSALIGEPVDGVIVAPLTAPAEGDATHPELAAFRAGHDAARRSEAAARRSALPDLAVYAASRWDALPEGSGATAGFEVGGGLEIPIFDLARDDVREATARRAEAEAALARAEAERAAAVEGARRRVAALALPAEPVDAEAVWQAATLRYDAGEASLEELLQAAEAVEASRLASIEQERRLRAARLDLACAIGRFDEPTIRSAFEESLR